MNHRQQHRQILWYRLKRIFWKAFVALFLFFVAINTFLQTEMAQSYLARQLSDYLSKELNIHIEIEKVRVTLMMDILLQNVRIDDAHQNPMITVKYFYARLNNADFTNNIFRLSEAEMVEGEFTMRKYEGEYYFNYTDLTGKPDTLKKKSSELGFGLYCRNARMTNCRFNLIDENQTPRKESLFDWNNLHLTLHKVEARRLSVNDKEISVDFKNITVSDVSGFQVDKLTTVMRFADDGWYFDNAFILTPQSTLDFDLKFEYSTFNNIPEFVDSITIVADVRPSILSVSDIAYFAESLKNYDMVADLETKFHGTLRDFSINDFKLQAGTHTNINMDARLQGILDPETAHLKVALVDLTTSLSDIKNFNLPLNTASLSPFLHDIPFSITSFFEGTINQFETETVLETEIGTITAQINMERSKILRDYQYYGVINGTDIHAGFLAGVSPDFLRQCSFSLSFDGSGSSLNNADVNMRLTMDSLYVNHYYYKNIQIDGQLFDKQFDGSASIDDKNVKFDFNGIVNLKDSLPMFDFNAELKNANLTLLHLLQGRSENFRLSSKMQIEATGYSIDNIRGHISIKDFTMIENNSMYAFKELDIITYNDTITGERNIKVRSDLLDANLKGDFQLSNINKAFAQFFGSYVASIQSNNHGTNTFDLSHNMLCDVQLKNISPVTRFFMPELQIPDGLTASQSIDFEENIMHTKCNAPTIIYNGVRGTNFYLDAATRSYGTTSDLGFSKISILEKDDSTVLGIEEFNVNALVIDDSIKYSISWDRLLGDDIDISYLDGRLSFINYPEITVSFTDMAIVFQEGAMWHVEPDNAVVFDSSGIAIRHLKFYSNTPYIIFDGTINKDVSSSLSMKLNQNDLSTLNKILDLSGINTYGLLSGNVLLKDPYNHLRISADLTVDKWKINENQLGNAAMRLEWDSKEPSIFVDLNSVLSQTRGDIYPIFLNGHYYPKNPHKNFDMKVKLENIGLNAIAPYLTDYVTNIKGYISGEMTVTGTQKDPQINGAFTVQRGMARIPYTGVLYTMGGNIIADNKAFTFQNFSVSDSMANQAFLEGSIRHKGFKDFNLDLSLKPKNFTLFNINDVNNDIFYGAIKSTGNISVTGPFDNIKINSNVSTDKGTEITIPLNTAAGVGTSDFVIFTKPADSTTHTSPPPAISPSTGMDLKLNVNVTPEGMIHIFLPGDAGKISSAGTGNLLLRLDENNNFGIYGTYIIQKGEFNLTLQQLNITLINKILTLNKGSYIQFNGDPSEATMNVTATYTVQSSLEALNLPLDSAKTQKRIPVNCMIHMREKLSDPEIRFSVSFPTLHDEDIKSNIYTKLDTTNTAEMTRQAFSLLLLGTFTSDEYSASAGSMASSSISMLTGQINNWLSHVVKGVDIGVNYRGGEQVTGDDFDVFLRKGMFNDRVVIDANVGRTTSTTGDNAQSSAAAIDASIEIKITERWRFKAFNRSNANDISKTNEYGYTYGIGASYGRNFNRISDMFDNSDHRKPREEKKKLKNKN